MRSLFVLLLFLSLVSSQEIKVGTIVNAQNSFFFSKDQPILQGVQLWARWVNENGGVLLGGVPHNISVITRYIDGEDSLATVQNASRLLAEEDQVDLMIPMFSTQRLAWSYAAAQAINPNILHCGVGASVDTLLFSGGINYYGTSRGISGIVTALAEIMLALSDRKTFSILYPTESAFYVTLSQLANATIHNAGADVLFYQEYDSDRENVDVALLSQSLSALKEENADVFWFVNNFGDDIATMNLVMKAQSYTPSAALVGASLEAFTTTFFNQANYWISATTYHPDLPLGTSGIHMGTMSEYAAYFNQVHGFYPDITWTVTATACGVLLQLATEVTDAAGLDWRNATDVNNAMKALNQSDPLAETFFGRVRIDNKNANANSKNYPVQMIDGDWKLLTSERDAVYPAPWPWREEDDSSLDVGTTVGIIVGCIVGACLLMMVIGAVVVLVLYLIKRKFYHLIFLPKGKTYLSERKRDSL